MLDIHTHLYWDSYDTDREEVIARARAAGLKQMLVVGTTIEESRQALAIASQYPDVYASVGIHPNEFRKETDNLKPKTNNTDIRTYNLRQKEDWEEELRVLAGNSKVVAIGECGLDYSESHGEITEAEKELQKRAFLKQISLATELHLPLIIHCRPTNSQTQDAYEDLYQILTKNQPAQNASHIDSGEQPKTNNKEGETQIETSSLVIGHQLSVSVILHCYMGDTEVTRAFLQLPHVYFSFTGNITYPVKKHLIGTKDDLTETVKLIPKERIFVETDCPFLSPQAKRGERNEPAYVVHTAEKVCELLSMTREALDTQLEENFRGVFVGS